LEKREEATAQPFAKTEKKEGANGPNVGAVALACLLGCTGTLIHGFVDSNLQIPANAALFYSLCAIAAAKTKFGMRRRRRSVEPEQADLAVGAIATGDSSS
jgi:hypothetical protein